MRTLVLVIVMLVVVGGGFYFVAVRGRPPMAGPSTSRAESASGATTKRAPHIVPTSLPAASPNASVIGQSGGVFLESRDPISGRITHKFRAESLDPHRDGTVGVVKPEVRFYGKDNASLIVLEGSGGTVITSTGGNPDDPRSIGASTPTSGQLNDVVLRFFEVPRGFDLARDEERLLATKPTITVNMVGVKFDALANRVATFDGVIDGKPVPAERMPVTVRGRDFELDGQGLTLTWNDRTGRLESLVIERGDRLLVTDVSKFGGSTLLSLSPPRIDEGPFAARPPAFGMMNLLDGVVAVEVPTTSTGTTTAPAHGTQRDLYHATFDKDVTVTRGGKQVASADALVVALILGEKKEADRPPTRRSRPNHKPATSRPTDPVEVHWTGKLTVRPSVNETDQSVELVGKPAWVRENGAEARGAIIRVEPETGRVRIAPGAGVELIQVRDAQGGALDSTSTLSVDQEDGTIVVDGPGTLKVPPGSAPSIAGGTTRPAPTSRPATQPTTVTWSRRLQIDVGDQESTDGGKPRQYLKAIAIQGDADVRSATMNAQAERLQLTFTEPAAEEVQPTTRQAANGVNAADAEARFEMPAADFSRLRVVEAQGAARLQTVDADAREQGLAAQQIRIDFKPGANGLAVSSLAADGNVALRNADGSTLDCGGLDVLLDPNAASAVGENGFDQIRRLVATNDVRLKQIDGSSASAQRVDLVGEGRARKFKLTGQPAEVATARGALRGATIDLDPRSGSVAVPGPGAFVGNGEAGAGTMALSWTGAMAADGNDGICTLRDGVLVDGTDAAGTHLLTKAGNAVIRFDTKGSPTSRPTSSEAAVARVSLDSIRSLELTRVETISMTTPDGKRESTIETPTLTIDLVAGTVVAPEAGRMLLIERTIQPIGQPTTGPATVPSLAQPTPVASTEATKPASGNFGPGSLALMWQQSMNWKMRSGELEMVDGVRLGFEKENSDDPIRLTADRLRCTLAPIDPTAQRQSTGVDQVAQRVELKTINALGNVSVRSKAMSLNGGTLSYDLANDLATASSDAQTRLEVFDASGASQVGFSSFSWNVQTGIGTFNDVGARVRQ